ncbi:hypothetical protein LZP97_26800 (plasmid) [Rhodococcus sp. DMF-1]|uniref:hypothetical protein n=1 Tax=Rhodococcus TaxID=1827 RepID=UPI00065F6BDD|nr:MULTISPECIES: hypothetical protein [Rhodococcus]UIR36950.1 hypothetical protein LZP97_25790 [Rhodococcus sp. DMF-1]UIR39778.1 hypothetical protein LZP97_27220 [Rhodococcus sp. DMF-1]UIR39796.1 hypothetical protein LZP97_26800 [Rhodococcus sp. DMF-1]
MTSPVLTAIAEARQVITARGIDLTVAHSAYQSMHPQISATQLDLALTAEVAIILQLSGPYDTESVARQIANRSGAFPWDGPVGNGLTPEYYQSCFREMASEKVFIGKLLGLIKEDA